MITMRFPNGFTVQYNAAHTIQYVGSPHHSVRLVDSQDGWIADIPLASGVIIEVVAPCRVYQALSVPPDDVARQLKALNRRLGKMEKAVEGK